MILTVLLHPPPPVKYPLKPAYSEDDAERHNLPRGSASRLLSACIGLLPTFISDQSHNHRVEVEEEHQQVESQFDKRLLLVDIEFAENLGRVEEVVLLHDPIIPTCQYAAVFSPSCIHHSTLPANFGGIDVDDSLLHIPPQKRQIQNQRQPIPIDQKQHRQESMHGGFRDDVHVEAVAQVDRVDVVAFEIRVHDGEEDLEEEVHCVEQDGEEE